jgi:hypothetical protein
VGYIDDFYLTAETFEECQAGYHAMISLLRDLGFVVSEDKCVPCTTRITFLGIVLDTDTDGNGVCSASIDESRMTRGKTLVGDSLTNGRRTIRQLESLVGLLSFCSQVVLGGRIYTASAFSALTLAKRMAAERGMRGKSAPLIVHAKLFAALIGDLHWWCLALKAYNGKAVQVGAPRVVPSSFFSTDACTSRGMGGFFDGRWFSISWVLVRAMKQELFFPFRSECKESSMINYLELFAVYWALKLWGYLLRSLCVPARCDNTVACVMVGDLRGTLPHVPLLKEILRLQLLYDVRFRVRYIKTKDNILSDLVSRGEEDKFFEARTAWMNQDVQQADREDWQILPVEAKSLDSQLGPFDVAAYCDVWGANSHLVTFWTAESDCLRQDWDGRNVLCNPPFSIALLILLHFLMCKLRCPAGTSACFILPVWIGTEFWDLVKAMPRTFIVIRRWPRKTPLFTSAAAPTERGNRKFCGNTQWPVVAVWAGPKPITEEVPVRFRDGVQA